MKAGVILKKDKGKKKEQQIRKEKLTRKNKEKIKIKNRNCTLEDFSDEHFFQMNLEFIRGDPKYFSVIHYF